MHPLTTHDIPIFLFFLGWLQLCARVHVCVLPSLRARVCAFRMACELFHYSMSFQMLNGVLMSVCET